MKELQEIEERLAELNERYKDLNLDETGYFELRFIRRFYTSLHFREDEIVNTALRRRMNNEIDDIELTEIMSRKIRLHDEIEESYVELDKVINIKAALAKEKVTQKRELEATIAANKKLIANLRRNLTNFKKKIAGITDPTAKAILDEKVVNDQKVIDDLVESNKANAQRLIELTEEIRILAKGGKLPTVEEVKADTTDLTEEEAHKLEDEAEEEVKRVKELTETEEEEVEEETHEETREEPVPPVRPVISEDDDLTEGLMDDEDAHEAPRFTDGEPEPERRTRRTRTLDDELDDFAEEEEDFPEFDEPSEEELDGFEDDEPTDEEDEFPEFDEEEETKEEDFPEFSDTDEPEEEETEEEEDFPDFDEEDEDEELTDFDDEDLDEEEEEEEVVDATTRAPKAKLWSKIAKVLKAAGLFLVTVATAATAWHTGLIAKNTKTIAEKSNTETESETENETPMDGPEDVGPEKEPEKEPEKTEPEKEPEKTEPEKTEPEKTEPEKTEPEKKEPEKESKKEEEKKEEAKTGDVYLEPGESVYDTTTGVEVGYTGEATAHEDGKTTPQQKRDLEKTSDGKAKVTDKDLNKDEKKQEEKTTTELPRTGQEISEEEARKNMTEQEQKNLDEAIEEDDWSYFFDNGPSL